MGVGQVFYWLWVTCWIFEHCRVVLNRSQQNSVPKSIPSIHFIDLNVQQPSMMFIKLIVSVKSSLHCLLLVDCANCAELRALLVPCQIRERRQSSLSWGAFVKGWKHQQKITSKRALDWICSGQLWTQNMFYWTMLKLVFRLMLVTSHDNR